MLQRVCSICNVGKVVAFAGGAVQNLALEAGVPCVDLFRWVGDVGGELGRGTSGPM